MNLKELKEIIDIVTAKDSIEEIEIEKTGVRLRIKRSSNHVVSTAVRHVESAAAPAISSPPVPTDVVSEEPEGVYHIKSPIVGTFYKAASPTSEPFVSVGDFVERGTVLCVIEAMKLMNEIESEVSGEVIAVLVENAQPVEYGEKLFAIRVR